MSPARSLCLTALTLALFGCNASPQTSATQAERATLDSCRQRADQIYTTQNPRSRLNDFQRDSPQSSSYVEGVTTRGLGDLFSWDNMVTDCIRSGRGGGSLPGPASMGPAMEPSGLTP